MKKVNPMKRKYFLSLMFVAPLAFAQAPAPKPVAEVPKPAAQEAAPAPAPTAEAPKPAPAKKTRRSEDARQCLEQPNNNAVIKCAEAYL